jgi:hypothetical protein
LSKYSKYSLNAHENYYGRRFDHPIYNKKNIAYNLVIPPYITNRTGTMMDSLNFGLQKESLSLSKLIREASPEKYRTYPFFNIVNMGIRGRRVNF